MFILYFFARRFDAGFKYFKREALETYSSTNLLNNRSAQLGFIFLSIQLKKLKCFVHSTVIYIELNQNKSKSYKTKKALIQDQVGEDFTVSLLYNLMRSYWCQCSLCSQLTYLFMLLFMITFRTRQETVM